jgi:hypothetical protein
MKIAEALLLRADLQKRFMQLKERILSNAKVQEGDVPAEDPNGLLEEYERVAEELTGIIQRINKTNSVTGFQSGGMLADALALRDILRAKYDVYIELRKAASVKQDRYSKSEVKFKSTVSISDIQKRADQLAKEYRELDARIQEANWMTDLLE